MANQMIVYAAEKPYADKLMNNKVVAHLSPVVADKIPEAVRSAFENRTKQYLLSSAFASQMEDDNFDLHRLYTILVTVGWNLNDDVFGVKEVWAARHSPEDKPFNLEHNPRHVIGHITGCIAVDENYDVIDDDTSFEDLPSKFHLLTSAVIYKHVKSKDEQLTEETQALLQSIANGDWYVSMEAIFTDFDYALTDASGNSKIVARTEATAWMTKHLRIAQGSGEIQGYKIGRYLKNITFSGKGLVKSPGNPESYVFNDVSMFEGAFASQNILTEETSISSNEDNEMTVNAADMVAKTELNAAQAEIADLRKRLEAAQEEKVNEKISALEKSIASRDEQIKTINTELENVKASKAEALKAVETAKAEAEAANKKVAELEAAAAEAVKATAKANRISTLVEKGVEKTEAERLVEKFASASDEMFAELVEAQAKLVEAAKPKSEEKPTEKKKDDKKKAEAAAEAALENAEETEEAPLTTEASVNEPDEVMTALASFLGQEVNKNIKK